MIRSELLNVLLAGRDTTASLLTNVFFIISQRADIWEKLQADVQQLNGALPTFEQLKDLKYLKAVLNESLRCHPIVPINSRQALEDTTLPLGGGPAGTAPFFAKKGSIVSWNLYVMHRRRDLYGEDAEEFKPERWLDDPETGQKGIRPTWEYLVSPDDSWNTVHLTGVANVLSIAFQRRSTDLYRAAIRSGRGFVHCGPIMPGIQWHRMQCTRTMD